MGRRINSQFVFTKARLEALPSPEKREAWYYDKTTPGLALCVTAKGAKTLYLVKWKLTNTVRYRLGKLGEISIADARGEVVRLAGLMMAPDWDPQEAKRVAREEATLQDLWDWWLDDAKRRNKKTWREDERLWTNFLSAWKARRLSAIHTRDVAALHAKIGDENGRYQANRVLALLRAAFRRADKIGWKGDDPTRGVQAFPEKQRERFLDEAELKRLFTVLSAEPPLFRDFFLLALLTGARRGNLQTMRWEELNLDVGLWRIPETKNGHPVVVPLAPAAVELLKVRAADRDDSEWVFASRGETGHLIEPKGAWKRIRKAAAIEDVRIHDLRRTLGSWQAAGGSSLPIIGKSLGHRDGSPATAIYARLSLDPVRESVNKAAAAMLALAAPTEEKEIANDG